MLKSKMFWMSQQKTRLSWILSISLIVGLALGLSSCQKKVVTPRSLPTVNCQPSVSNLLSQYDSGLLVRPSPNEALALYECIRLHESLIEAYTL